MKPNKITVHCSATNPQNSFTKQDLHNLHVKRNGWSDIGYHFYIDQDGCVHACRPLTRTGAHVKGFNRDNIGICLEGGIDERGRAQYNFSDVQMEALHHLIEELAGKYNVDSSNIKGHRDYSPDLNGDGEITSDEYMKECPCFDVQDWLTTTGLGE